MDEFENMINKVKPENLLQYLVYDSYTPAEEGSKKESKEGFQKRIKEADEQVLSRLERKYPTASRNDNELFDILSDYILEHDNVFFEAGLLVGFQIFKGLENAYQAYGKADIQDIIMQPARNKGENKSLNSHSFLELLWENQLESSLQEAGKKDSRYQKADEEVQQTIGKVEDMEMTGELWQTVDQAFSATNDFTIEYGRIAYFQGFKDALQLLSELKEMI